MYFVRPELVKCQHVFLTLCGGGGCAALNNSDDSMDSASDDAQDDDDPSYTPGRPIDTDKGESVLDMLLG